MMKLTLLLPGLIWPDPADGSELLKALPLPAFAKLLSRGKATPYSASLSALLAQPWGGSSLGIARVLAAKAGLPAHEGDWLLADPVHIRIDRDRALLADVGVLRLSQLEAESFSQSLNQHFNQDGWQFYPIDTERWLLQIRTPVMAQVTPLPDVVGENIHDYLPKGVQSLEWSRALNEVQMLLYNHPANDIRELRGELTVNSLWLWGEGDSPCWPQCNSLLLSDHTLMQTMAQHTQTPYDAMPYDYVALTKQTDASEVCVLVDHLLAPSQYHDAWGWHEALKNLEQHWFTPLLEALKQGKLTELTLLAQGAPGVQIKLKPTDLWKVWRYPKTLAQLHQQLCV